jgi:hypothetical protein
MDITTTTSGVTMTGSYTQGVKTVLHPVSELETAKAVFGGGRLATVTGPDGNVLGAASRPIRGLVRRTEVLRHG